MLTKALRMTALQGLYAITLPAWAARAVIRIAKFHAILETPPTLRFITASLHLATHLLKMLPRAIELLLTLARIISALRWKQQA
jgi:hypothetical protein